MLLLKMSTASKTLVSILLVRNTKGNTKQIYEILSKFQPSVQISTGKVGGGNSGNNIVQAPMGGGSLKWDKPHCGQGVQF